jgi:hypothetical protein
MTSDAEACEGIEIRTAGEDSEVKRTSPDQSTFPGMLVAVPDPRPPQRQRTPARASTRGCRLPKDWTPPPEVIARQREEYPFLNLREIFVDFRQYWFAKAGAAAVKLDWSLTWQRWVRREASDFRGRRNGRNAMSTVDEKALGWQEVGR